MSALSLKVRSGVITLEKSSVMRPGVRPSNKAMAARNSRNDIKYRINIDKTSLSNFGPNWPEVV